MPERKIKKEYLVEDTRQLLAILEESHPDPYLKGGGKIAFHRRFQEVLFQIPEEGLTVNDFYRLLLPLMASVGDGHTFLLPPWPAGGAPILPVQLNIVGQTIYVEGVFRPGLENLWGARLQAINDIPFPLLLERLKILVGWDNEYQLMTYFCRFLNDRGLIKILIPDWNERDPLKIEFLLPGGQSYSLEVRLEVKEAEARLEPPSKINLPSTEKIDFAYNFLDPQKETALLRLDGMFSYRENFEFFRSMGTPWVISQAAAVYKKFYQKDPPGNLDSLVAALPSATETFRQLIMEMKKARTKRLIIDLRKNTGGNSLMANILGYFLFPETEIKKASTTLTIKKYSNLYFANYPNDPLEKINEGRKISLVKTDYDFADDPYFQDKFGSAPDKESQKEKWLKMTPTFYTEYRSGLYKNYYRPAEIIIISSAWTYSSAYTLMAMFYKMGAKIVGVPSGQAGTCYGDTLSFQLKNTGIRGYISHKLFVAFPENPELGRILPPLRELTYEDLVRFRFDPNSSILLALEKF
ncbi:MAG: S41 family peptidase [Candidatus Saccharicenans sp.]